MSAPGQSALVRRLLLPWILPVTSGVLLALALPPFDFLQAGWLALVPLLFALEKCTWGEAFRRGYIAGLVFFGMTVWWVVHVTLPGVVGLIAFLALYFGLAGMMFVAARSLVSDKQDSAAGNALVALVAAAGWVTIEWVRGKFLFGGFGWNWIGVTQHRAVPLIQFASITGVYGVSALLVFVNYAFYFTIRRFVAAITGRQPMRRPSWEFYLAMLLVCGAFLFGIRELRRERTTRSLRLALVQGNIPQTLKFVPEQKPVILDTYKMLTLTAIAGRPDIIIWPETATPEAMRYDIDSFSLVTNLAQAAHAYLLTGTIDATPYADPPEYYNAAILVEPDGRLNAIYRKIHLVPFGEYVPLRKIVPVLKWLTPITESFERGREYTVFRLTEREDLAFGAVICFEDTVPEVFRKFVERGVDFMVNLTNDAWFKQSPAAEMHLANAIFRAVENRRPLVRATNHGVTCVVDEFGFVRRRLEPFVEGSLNYTLEMSTDRRLTAYTRYGDVFVGLCAIVAGVALPLGAWRKRRAGAAS